MTTEEKAAKTYHFKTEVSQVLNILIHSLYKDRDIFLRELISNASDALTRLQFEMLTNHDVLDPDEELAIHIDVPDVPEGEPKKIVIKDSGIGMTKEEIIVNLGTIAQSGAREFLAKLEDNGDISAEDMIGQFGVGFYSVFMVASEVRVVSRSYKKRAKAVAWISDGGEDFRVEPADKADRGTEIHITLRRDAEEFASEWKLKEIVKRYSDFVAFPIYVGETQANQQTPLWRKRPSDVEPDDYNNFYRQMTMNFEEPLAVIHFSSDAPVNVRALLFIPASREPGILSSRKEPGVMLYSHNVLIQEYCTDLLPQWLQFIDGVVDSEDLPLNVSRESVQNNRFMAQLGKMITKRVLRELRKMAEDDPEKYEKFWQEFGRYLKEGVAIDPMAKEDVLPFLRYQSSKSEGKLISLDEYVERMGEGQEAIYYALGDSLLSVARSPHLDPFKERDIEVLYWIDPLDALIAPVLGEYKEKPFKNIDSAELDLPEQEDKSEEEAEATLDAPELEKLTERFKSVLGDKVTEVRPSKVLRNSPMRLVNPENALNAETYRIQRLMNQDYEVPQKIVELNRSHPLIVNLAHLTTNKPDDAVIDLTIEQLYDSALLQEGLHPNPAEMLPRIEQILAVAVQDELGE